MKPTLGQLVDCLGGKWPDPSPLNPQVSKITIAVWHQHAGEYDLGKSEPAGLAGNPMHQTGAALAKLGYVVLCPDALCFEERQDPDQKLSGGVYERYEFCVTLSKAGARSLAKN